MKMIIAIIRPHALDAVRNAVGEMGVEGMTVTEAKGYGRQKGHTEIYRGAEYQIDFVPKLRVEIAVEASRAGPVIDAIANATRTGKIGDGKIFVMGIDDVVRVRTNEHGVDAL